MPRSILVLCLVVIVALGLNLGLLTGGWEARHQTLRKIRVSENGLDARVEHISATKGRTGFLTEAAPQDAAKDKATHLDNVDVFAGKEDNRHRSKEISLARTEQFWKAYRDQRNNLLRRGDGDATYLVFSPADTDLGAHMVGMMSAFVLSIALGRIFVHDWNARTSECEAVYDDLFLPPFSPWSSKAKKGSQSRAEGLLFDSEEGRRWDGLPPPTHISERNKCTIDLAPGGVDNGGLDTVFITNRGRDPMAECRVLHVTTDQYLVQALADPAYGAPYLSGVPLSRWLGGGDAVAILFAGLFRPVDAVTRRVENAAAQLFPLAGPTVAAHALGSKLEPGRPRESFSTCLKELVHQRKVSTVIMATNIVKIGQDARTQLTPNGTTVTGLHGVVRTRSDGLGSKADRKIKKVQTVLVELLLISKSDIVLTSPRSSFSAIAAAAGGLSVQRVGGVSCEEVDNEPEFHMLGCGMPRHLNLTMWQGIYSFVDGNRKRCAG